MSQLDHDPCIMLDAETAEEVVDAISVALLIFDEGDDEDLKAIQERWADLQSQLQNAIFAISTDSPSDSVH